MTAPAAAAHDGRSLLTALLREQQDLGAAETFARAHDRGEIDPRAAQYRRLMPAVDPQPGQQYAFEVDLDRCTGCKACVTGCHNRNGLDPDETWRSVGLLLGGDDVQPLLRHVTTACHHCLDPACLTGCPVRAYEKDPRTGIVSHLDDQCIGCKYCVMKCPYGVPQYSKARGIVRKCDLCTDRLAHGEAPACVQACPTEAIRITLVDSTLAPADCADRFAAVPGAPDAAYTRPTTSYRSHSAATPAVIATMDLPGDAHPSLVVMLTLTQAAIGVFIGARLLPDGDAARGIAAALGVSGAVAGLAAAIFHLGRPRWAFRAVLGLRTSWLSREIVAMSVFVALAASAVAADLLGASASGLLGDLGAVAGIAALYCSAMVYRDTPRPHWARPSTQALFFLTSAASGGLLVLLAHGLAASHPPLAVAVIAAAALVAKLVFEVMDRARLAPDSSRRLLAGQLQPLWRARLACAALCFALLVAAATTTHAASSTVLAGAAWLLGDGIERHLFFRAAVAPRMP
jgi:Fe-S-cluster-containing dehydrogenase component/DMSO reductase anchor subunit